MTQITKTSKEDIIKKSFEILRNDGEKALNVRNIAKSLDCSTQPIYYQFRNMEELNGELNKEALKIHQEYMQKDFDPKRLYRSIGCNYLTFAIKEKNLFRYLFMKEETCTLDEFIESDLNYNLYINTLVEQTGLTKEEAKIFHKTMYIYLYGIACLTVNKTTYYTEYEVDDLLSDSYKALMLLEVAKGNIKKKHLENQVKQK